MIALIAYNVGGAIRLVDARGKDAEPLSILAQDNMLHIDNTPFNEEYKMILTWEKGKPSGEPDLSQRNTSVASKTLKNG